MLIQDILSKDSELFFIDIGANIGTYTLAIAKMNIKVREYFFSYIFTIIHSCYIILH